MLTDYGFSTWRISQCKGNILFLCPKISNMDMLSMPYSCIKNVVPMTVGYADKLPLLCTFE